MGSTPIRVLLVDDELPNLQVYAFALERGGYDVETAQNARDAIALLKSREFHVVITDMLMPDGDGVELLMFIRTLDPRPGVIPMSGGGSHLRAAHALNIAVKMGGVAPLVKPFSRQQLLDAVRSVAPPQADPS